MTTDMNSSSTNPPAPQPKRRLRTVFAVVGLLGLGGLIGAGMVHAQMNPYWGGPGGWRHGDGPRWGGPGRGPEMMGRRGPERLARFCANDTARFHPVVRAYAKADLRLTDAQAKEFDALADQVLPALEGVKKEACDNIAAISDKAPEKLAQLSGVLRKAADAADKAVEPARKFYASLDATQQARVDELADRRGRRWR